MLARFVLNTAHHMLNTILILGGDRCIFTDGNMVLDFAPMVGAMAAGVGSRPRRRHLERASVGVVAALAHGLEHRHPAADDRLGGALYHRRPARAPRRDILWYNPLVHLTGLMRVRGLLDLRSAIHLRCLRARHRDGDDGARAPVPAAPRIVDHQQRLSLKSPVGRAPARADERAGPHPACGWLGMGNLLQARSRQAIGWPRAAVAQLVEQRIRNAWVGGSSPFSGTRNLS